MSWAQREAGTDESRSHTPEVAPAFVVSGQEEEGDAAGRDP